MAEMSEGGRRVVELALAGLLHDVGKLRQRALSREEDHDQLERAVETFCPTFDGRPSHRHAGHTARFIEQHLAPLFEHGRGDQNVLGWAARHHAPSTTEEHIVAEADRLSAGMDRGTSPETPFDPNYWKDVIGRRLEPVLGRVSLSRDGKAKSCGRTLPLASLGLDRDSLMPRAQPIAEAEESRRCYRELLDRLERHAREASGAALPAALVTLQSALELTTSMVPADTTKAPFDVSLYDHLRTTAALAACMAREVPSSSAEGVVRDRHAVRYLLACGDISGIQQFLYSVNTEGAAKALRGRSLSVALMADAVSTHLLAELELPATNLLYSGGGKLYLLLPASAAERVTALAEEMDLFFLRRYGGTIGFALGLAPMTGADLIDKRAGEKWVEAHRALLEARRRRLHGLAATRYDDVFAPIGPGAMQEACGSCRRDVTGEPADGLCPSCRVGRDLGAVLPRASLLVRFHGPRARAEANDLAARMRKGDAAKISFADVVSYLLLARSKEATAACAELGSSGEVVVFGLGPELPPSGASAGRATWLIARNRPEDAAGAVQSYDDLARRSAGAPRLGILRGDVDDLGLLFERGLPRAERTLSRIATLSRSLSLFFSGHLAELVVSDADLATSVQVVYSGGDDLFLVGAWDRLPGLALLVRQRLGEYAAGNPDVTLSAGVAMVPPGYPLRRGAELAEALEKAAKEHRRPGRGRAKDAVALLGRALSWNDLRVAAAVARDLAAWVEGGTTGAFSLFDGDAPEIDKRLPRGVLQRLLAIHRAESDQRDREARQAGKTLEELSGDLRRGRWHWEAAYSLGRAARGGAGAAFLDGLRDSLARKTYGETTGDQFLVDYLDVPAAWAAIITRAGGDTSREVK
jgi:CRISPR-associated protein Csm1